MGMRQSATGPASSLPSLVPLFLLLLLAGCAWAQPRSAGEYQVKAAFLYNFAKFVDWPPDAFPQPSAPLHLCVFGEDPFGGELERIVHEKIVAGHPLRVLQPKRIAQARGCHILFVSSWDPKEVHSLLEALKGSSTLTVGETREFTRLGGMITFLLASGRVRFEINPDAAHEARLKISAKLLSLARIAHSNSGGGS
jgi:hypothetical protein